MDSRAVFFRAVFEELSADAANDCFLRIRAGGVFFFTHKGQFDDLSLLGALRPGQDVYIGAHALDGEAFWLHAPGCGALSPEKKDDASYDPRHADLLCAWGAIMAGGESAFSAPPPPACGTGVRKEAIEESGRFEEFEREAGIPLLSGRALRLSAGWKYDVSTWSWRVSPRQVTQAYALYDFDCAGRALRLSVPDQVPRQMERSPFAVRSRPFFLSEGDEVEVAALDDEDVADRARFTSEPAPRSGRTRVAAICNRTDGGAYSGLALAHNRVFCLYVLFALWLAGIAALFTPVWILGTLLGGEPLDIVFPAILACFSGILFVSACMLCEAVRHRDLLIAGTGNPQRGRWERDVLSFVERCAPYMLRMRVIRTRGGAVVRLARLGCILALLLAAAALLIRL